MIAYTDASHDVKRSQTGSVIQIGDNVITWRSQKQATISMSSAESEAQALAATEVIGDFIKALRESTCIPTPVVELRCDNNAARVFTTGDGSWRTKSTANKVARVKEKMEALNSVRVVYVSTKAQHADSLTKFLKSGQEQKKALQQLSLEEITTGVPQISASTVMSIQLSTRRRRRTRRTRSGNSAEWEKSFEFGLISFSVATSAQTFAKRCLTIAEMVKFIRPPCDDVAKLGEDDFQFPTYKQLLEDYPVTEDPISQPIGPAEILSIACKTDMVPMKDFDLKEFGDVANYLPDEHVKEVLANNKVKIEVPNPSGEESRIYTVSRWAYIPVDQTFRPKISRISPDNWRFIFNTSQGQKFVV